MENCMPSPASFLFDNTNGYTCPNDLILSIIEDVSSTPIKTDDSLSSSPPDSSSDLSLAAIPVSFPCSIFRSKPNSHPFQERCIPLDEPVKIGRAVARLKALQSNGIFDCKVLSRQHAKLWYEDGKFYLQDTKSSNGTFVNNQRLGKCNEDSPPYEIYTGDIIQFGVDVTENNRKTTHNCIIMEAKLFYPNGNEVLPRHLSGQAVGQMKEADINTQTLYQLSQYLQEAMHREQMLEQKLDFLQGVLRDTQQTSDDSWQAIIHEDRLLTRINILEDQIRIYRTKHTNGDVSKEELAQRSQSYIKFEEESKMKLEKLLLERAEATGRSKSLECSLQLAQDELKRFEDQNQEHQVQIQQLAQSIDDQHPLISELEMKLRDSETRCTELDNEKHRMKTDFDEYYQRTHHLEESQKKPIQKGSNHNRFQVHSLPIDPIIENNSSLDLSIPKEKNEELLTHLQSDSIGDHQNGCDIPDQRDSNHRLVEAQKQLALLRERLNQTKEHLNSTEDLYRNEQDRFRSLTSDYQSNQDELVQLKVRLLEETNDNNKLVHQQQNELDSLSQTILSKQNEHEHLLAVYMCFFLSCYVLIFLLFFCLLSW